MDFDALSVEYLADRTEAPCVHGVLCVNEAALVIASQLVVLLQDLELFVERQVLHAHLSLLHLKVHSFCLNTGSIYGRSILLVNRYLWW